MDSSLLEEEPAQHPACTQHDPVPNASTARVDINEKNTYQGELLNFIPASNNLALFLPWEKAP